MPRAPEGNLGCFRPLSLESFVQAPSSLGLAHLSYHSASLPEVGPSPVPLLGAQGSVAWKHPHPTSPLLRPSSPLLSFPSLAPFSSWHAAFPSVLCFFPGQALGGRAVQERRRPHPSGVSGSRRVLCSRT